MLSPTRKAARPMGLRREAKRRNCVRGSGAGGLGRGNGLGDLALETAGVQAEDGILGVEQEGVETAPVLDRHLKPADPQLIRLELLRRF